MPGGRHPLGCPWNSGVVPRERSKKIVPVRGLGPRLGESHGSIPPQSTTSSLVNDREFLRHAVATLAYRAAKALRGAPASFADFQPGPASKTAVQIVAHMGDLFDWALSMANGAPQWKTATPQPWEAECARFFESVRRFDDMLASDRALAYETTRLFQGPVADALTHTGQLAMMRRLHGAPIKGESYNRAEVVTGRVGAEQTPPDPKFEFD